MTYLYAVCGSRRMTLVDITFQWHSKMSLAIQYNIMSPFMMTS